MTDLDDRLRQEFRAARARVEHLTLPDITDREPPAPHRSRARAAVGAALVVLFIVGVAVVVQRVRTHRAPTTPPAIAPVTGDVADLHWTRSPEPAIEITRVVSANGHTYALGVDNSGAAIDELAPDGSTRTVFHGANQNGTTDVNDLIGVPGVLVAVGDANGEAAAWRSTDDGASWQPVNVEQPPPGQSPGNGLELGNGPALLGAPVPIKRIFASGGRLYAFGESVYAFTNGRCPQAAWTATADGDFTVVPPDGPDACGGIDTSDGPAGFVSIERQPATAIVGGVEYVIAPGDDNAVAAIAGDDHGYVAVGATNTTGTTVSPGAIWWSADGKTWTRVVTATPPDHRFARFAGVVHTPAGWIAVGYSTHPGANEKVNDAIMWTSSDGRHWTNDARDDGTFEQYAQPVGIGATVDGFTIFGRGNVTGEGVKDDPLGSDNVLWNSSTGNSTTPVGIVEGTMREIGGPAPGEDVRVTGTLTLTARNGHSFTALVGDEGRFSTPLLPGTYHVVGHSPAYGNGSYDCTAGGPITLPAYGVAHVNVVCPVR